MQGNRQINRGDIYYADLTPTIGSEQGGIRPVVIIQNDKGNLHSPTVIAAAVTGNAGKKLLPTHVRLGDSACGLFRHSIVLLEQLRTIDRRRLQEYVGTLDADRMNMVDAALAISVGLDMEAQHER
ncbi:MAG TPA: PemK family transcriptional regulator [Clostridiales bacterium]|jgi:mRNA interferase MazF|nr:PemK family transcriptional regulator [Clostridiales bacterium]